MDTSRAKRLVRIALFKAINRRRFYLDGKAQDLGLSEEEKEELKRLSRRAIEILMSL